MRASGEIFQHWTEPDLRTCREISEAIQTSDAVSKQWMGTGRTVPEERHGRRSDTASFHSGSHGNGKRYCNLFYGVRCSVPE